jgi:hypothetical protein
VLVLDLGGMTADRLGEGVGLLVLVLAAALRLVEPGPQIALLGAGQPSHLVRVLRVALDQGQGVQHRVVDVGGDFGPLLRADAHQALLGEVLGHPDQIGAREQRDADEDREGGLEHRAEVGRGALEDEYPGDAGGDQQNARRGPQQRERTATAADLRPAGPPRVVRLAPDQGDTRADEDRRPQIRLRAAAEIHIADEDHGHDDHEEEGDDLALVRLAGHEPAPAVGRDLGGERRCPAAGTDATDAERHEEPERGVQQCAESVRHEQSDEHQPHPDHGQPEMPGEPSRHAPEPASVAAAVELARGPRVFDGHGCGFRHAIDVHTPGGPEHQGRPPILP